jgi:multidrug efflux pump subunit AcrA (membrane-fusion protein)
MVANPKGGLLVGQFVTVTITLPVPPGEVAIPAGALVETGKEAIVFIQPDPQKLEYVQRRVAVVRRGRDVVHVRSTLRPEEARQGLQALRPGERVVTAGAVELQALLADLQEQRK